MRKMALRIFLFALSYSIQLSRQLFTHWVFANKINWFQWLLNGYLRLKKHFFWSRIAIDLCRHNNLWRVRLVLWYLWQEFTIFPNLGRCHHIAIKDFETLEYKELFWSLLEREFVIFPYRVHIQIYIDKIYYDKISLSLGLYVAIV